VLWTRFPFGLFEKIGRPILRDAVLVYPRLRALAPGDLPAAFHPGWQERMRRGQGASLYNLRPYRAGDDPRLIHWRTSARLGEPMLKELAEEDRPRVRLVLQDPVPGCAADRLEADLSLAASLAAWVIRSGTALELITAEGATGFGDDEAHLERIFQRLALYAPPGTPRRMALVRDDVRSVRLVLGAGGFGQATEAG
jgi:uncharacterized protein (DUF58 family)